MTPWINAGLLVTSLVLSIALVVTLYQVYREVAGPEDEGESHDHRHP